MEIIYLYCPKCVREFYISPEFLLHRESYCECPFCHAEFAPVIENERTNEKIVGK